MINPDTYTPFPSKLHIKVLEYGVVIYDSRTPNGKFFGQADSGRIPHAKISLTDSEHEIIYWVEKIDLETSKLPAMYDLENESFIELHVKEFRRLSISKPESL